jgi:hypothetical protein
MKKEEAKEIILRVIASYRGTLAEHQAIQEAFKVLIGKDGEKKDDK